MVFDTVTITPPYKLDNVRAHAECKALVHIRKVVSINAELAAEVTDAYRHHSFRSVLVDFCRHGDCKCKCPLPGLAQ